MHIRTDCESQFCLPEHNDVSFETRQATIQHLYVSDRYESSRTLKNAKSLQGLNGKFRRDAEQYFGKQKYRRFRDYISKESKNYERRLEPPEGPQMPLEKILELRRKSNDKVSSYLSRLGVSEEKYKKIIMSQKKQFTELDDRGLSPRQDAAPLVKGSQVPKGVLRAGAGLWKTMRPPYWGSHWSYSWNLYGFSENAGRLMKPETGYIYNHISLLNYMYKNCDDCWGTASHYTELGFWYQLKHSGRVEVWIEAEAADVKHHLLVWDSLGWSDSYVSQDHYLSLRVDDQLSLARMSWFWEDGYTDGAWDVRYLTQNGTYWAHLTTNRSYLKNQWVCIWVGARTSTWCEANDVTMENVPMAYWNINSVYIV